MLAPFHAYLGSYAEELRWPRLRGNTFNWQAGVKS